MPFCIALAVREMRMTPDEALWVGDRRRGARRCAARTSATCGSAPRATPSVLEAPSHLHLAYRPGVPLVAAVWRGGELVARRRRRR